MIIGVSGRINSGKDTVGSIVKYWLNWAGKGKAGSYSSYMLMDHWYNPMDWQIKKFADKLKYMTALLTGATLEQLEDREFKNSYLPPCWDIEKQMTECDGNDGVDGYAVMPMTYREFMQKLGTEAIRNGLHSDTWVNALMADYDSSSNWIITDLRFPNEYESIKRKGGICIRVHRSTDIVKEESNEVLTVSFKKDGVPTVSFKEVSQPFAHSSETALDSYKFDYYLNNTGSIEDLVIDVKEMLVHFKLLD